MSTGRPASHHFLVCIPWSCQVWPCPDHFAAIGSPGWHQHGLIPRTPEPRQWGAAARCPLGPGSPGSILPTHRGVGPPGAWLSRVFKVLDGTELYLAWPCIGRLGCPQARLPPLPRAWPSSRVPWSQTTLSLPFWPGVASSTLGPAEEAGHRPGLPRAGLLCSTPLCSVLAAGQSC